jgi:hypothetical protein
MLGQVQNMISSQVSGVTGYRASMLARMKILLQARLMVGATLNIINTISP